MRIQMDEFDKQRTENEKRINLIAIQLISDFENGKIIQSVKDGDSLDIIVADNEQLVLKTNNTEIVKTSLNPKKEKLFLSLSKGAQEIAKSFMDGNLASIETLRKIAHPSLKGVIEEELKAVAILMCELGLMRVYKTLSRKISNVWLFS